MTELRDARSPVFICGLGRGGTTLLRNLLDGHPELLVLPGETGYYRRVAGSRLVARGTLRALEAIDPTRASDRLARPPCSWTMADGKRAWSRTLKRWYFNWAKDAARPEAEVDRLVALASGTRGFWACALALVRTGVAEVPSADTWVEKTPFTERFVGIVERDFECGARYVHIVRDPRAVCASRVNDPARRATPRARLLADTCYDWSLSVRLAHHLEASLGDRYLALRFEDLVTHPRSVMQAVASHLGMTFDEVLLRPTLFGRPTVIYSSYEPIRPANGIETSVLDRGRNELTADELMSLQTLLQGQMASWGYAAQRLGATTESWARGWSRTRNLRLRAIKRWQAVPSPVRMVRSGEQ